RESLKRDPFHQEIARKALNRRVYGLPGRQRTNSFRPRGVTSLSTCGHGPQAGKRLPHRFFESMLHGDPFAVFAPVVGTRGLARGFELGQRLPGGIARPDIPLGRGVPDGSVGGRAESVDLDRDRSILALSRVAPTAGRKRVRERVADQRDYPRSV